MIKVIITIALTILMSFGVFAQSKNKPSKEAIEKLMYVKKGMISVNTMAENMTKSIDINNVKQFKTEMLTAKTKMLTKAFKMFTNDYSAEQINAIYKECTSDEINYTDQTNNFFAKWRKIKGTFFKKSKEIYFKYK